MIYELHIHSRFSFDSILSPEKIVVAAVKKGLDGIAITDHNTIQGALEASKIRTSKEFEVLIGTEINTNAGDIIGLCLNEEVRSRRWEDVIDDIRNQGGLVILPHPFKGHKPSPDLIPHLVSSVDAIETFNSRIPFEMNLRAEKLANDCGKAAVAGSDAHFSSEIGLGRTFWPFGDFRKALVSRETSPFGCISSRTYLQSLSQLVKAGKQRRYSSMPGLAASAAFRFIAKS